MKGAYPQTHPSARPRRRRAAAGLLGRGARSRRRGISRGGRSARSSSFGLFSCSKATNEVNYLAQKFARGVIGSHNIDSCNRT